VTSPDALDRESEEVKPLVDRDDTGLLLREVETERADDLLNLCDQCLGVLTAASNAHDEVVRLCRVAGYAESAVGSPVVAGVGLEILG